MENWVARDAAKERQRIQFLETHSKPFAGALMEQIQADVKTFLDEFPRIHATVEVDAERGAVHMELPYNNRADILITLDSKQGTISWEYKGSLGHGKGECSLVTKDGSPPGDTLKAQLSEQILRPFLFPNLVAAERTQSPD
jgi:hypothetical protein